MRVNMDAWLDHKFWRWGMWFVYNSMWPGRAMRNHTAQQDLGRYSMKCLHELEVCITVFVILTGQNHSCLFTSIP